MERLTDEDLEGLNDTLAAAMRDKAKMGVATAEALYHLCCEVQAWRRWAAMNEDDGEGFEYNPNDHEIIPVERN